MRVIHSFSTLLVHSIIIELYLPREYAVYIKYK